MRCPCRRRAASANGARRRSVPSSAYQVSAGAIDASHGIDHASRLAAERAFDLRIQPTLAAPAIDDSLGKLIDRVLEGEDVAVAVLRLARKSKRCFLLARRRGNVENAFRPPLQPQAFAFLGLP